MYINQINNMLCHTKGNKISAHNLTGIFLSALSGMILKRSWLMVSPAVENILSEQ
jgi:hypothetical protein